LSAARVQFADETDRLVGEHLLLTGPRARADQIAAVHHVVQASYIDRQATVLIHASGPVHDPAWTTRAATLEEVVLAYMNSPETGRPPTLKLAEPTEDSR
jgi:ABC-2 type transport system ATP-binding protein